MTRVSPASSDSGYGTNVGLLSRTLQVRPANRFGQSVEGCSVFTLHHWASPESTKSSSSISSSLAKAHGHTLLRKQTCVKQVRSKFLEHRVRVGSRFLNHAQAKLALVRVQEAALNFLFRWLMLNDIDDDDDNEDCDSVEWPFVDNLNFEPGICCVLDLHRNSLPEQLVTGDDDKSTATPKPRSQSIDGLSRKGSNAFHEQIRKHHHHANSIDLILKDLPKLSNCKMSTVLRYVFWRWLTWANVFELVLIILLICCCAYQCYELLEEYYRYPTHVSVLSIMHDDFRTDLPAVTLCDNSRLSLDVLRKDYPEYNASHFLAISMGTFYSLNNFTIDTNRLKALGTGKVEHESNAYFVESNNDDIASETNLSLSTDMANRIRPKPARKSPYPLEIDWVRVVKFLSNATVLNHLKLIPKHSLFENIVCANIWGEKMPCNKLRRLKSIQSRAICETLFHESVMYDSHEPAVEELELASLRKPATMIFGDKSSDGNGLLQISDTNSDNEKSSWSFFSLADDLSAKLSDIERLKPSRFFHENQKLIDKLNKNNQLFATNEEEEADMERNKGDLRVEMVSKEIVRLRINFRGEDYANFRNVVGAKFSIHSNAMISDMSHKSYRILPGHWYAYYIDRFDYKRLPPPYDSRCYDYTMSSRSNWLNRMEWFNETKNRVLELLRAQSKKTDKISPELVSMYRKRSLSRVSSKSLLRSSSSSSSSSASSSSSSSPTNLAQAHTLWSRASNGTAHLWIRCETIHTTHEHD